MSTNEKKVLGLACGLALVAVGRRVVATEANALGLSPAELVILGVLAASVVSLIATPGVHR